MSSTRHPGHAPGPVPSELEALLRETLEERAEDVTWRPGIVAAATHGAPGRGPVTRTVRRSTAWFAAAATVAVLGAAAGVTAVLTASTRTDDPPAQLPAATGSFTASPTGTGRVEWVSCQAAFASSTLRPAQVTSDGVPSLTGSFTGTALVDRRVGRLQRGAPRLAASPTTTAGGTTTGPVTSPPDPSGSSTPTEGTTTDIPPTDTVTDTGTGSPSGTDTLTSSPARTGGGVRHSTPQRRRTTAPVAPVPTPGGGPTDPAAVAVWNDLGQVLDGRRFGGTSVGADGRTIVVHVVRGVDEGGARDLAASCARDGAPVTTDLVAFSTDQLTAVESDLETVLPSTVAPGAYWTSAWVDPDINRVVVTVKGPLTTAQWTELRGRYGDMLAVWSQDTGRFAASPTA